jgi:hypothetical protein
MNLGLCLSGTDSRGSTCFEHPTLEFIKIRNIWMDRAEQ